MHIQSNVFSWGKHCIVLMEQLSAALLCYLKLGTKRVSSIKAYTVCKHDWYSLLVLSLCILVRYADRFYHSDVIFDNSCLASLLSAHLSLSLSLFFQMACVQGPWKSRLLGNNETLWQLKSTLHLPIYPKRCKQSATSFQRYTREHNLTSFYDW